jgi:membrane protease YdiL (CAAX protease family)
VRIHLVLAWLLILGTFGTAALLRQFHHETPTSPFVSPIIGSALFAAIFLLMLVTAWERRQGSITGKGIRLGSITPLLIILLVEKWASLFIYPALFVYFSPEFLEPAFADMLFRAFAGISLISVCIAAGWFSIPTMRKVSRRARPARWPSAALAVFGVVGGSYLILAILSAVLGDGLRLKMPEISPLLMWVLGGQAILAFAEELYYRGLLMGEMERVIPRLGIRNAVARRWIALLTTSLLFGLEHLALGSPWSQSFRELTFVVALGLLFGILVTISSNLHFVAGVHAWINWLLLGAAPQFVNEAGRPALPPGAYIALTLILAFVLTVTMRRHKLTLAQPQPAFES